MEKKNNIFEITTIQMDFLDPPRVLIDTIRELEKIYHGYKDLFDSVVITELFIDIQGIRLETDEQAEARKLTENEEYNLYLKLKRKYENG